MVFWKNTLAKMSAYEAICRDLKEAESVKDTAIVNITGLGHVHKAHFIHAISENLNKFFLLVVSDEGEASRLAEDLTAFGKETLFFPTKELSLRSFESTSKDFEQMRIGVLSRLLNEPSQREGISGIVTTVQALSQYTLPPEALADRTINIKLDSRVDIKKLTSSLISGGYERCDQIEGKGQFALRGGIIDVFPASSLYPIRFELWGDTVDSLCYFDLITQRRTDSIKEVFISPAREIMFDEEEKESFLDKVKSLPKGMSSRNAPLFKEKLGQDIEKIDSGLSLASYDKYISLIHQKPATLFDYLDKRESIVFVSEWVGVKERLKAFNSQLEEDIRLLLSDGELCKALTEFTLDGAAFEKKLESCSTIIMDSFGRTKSDLHLKSNYNIQAKQLPAWSGSVEVLAEDLEFYLSQKMACVVLAGSEIKNAQVLTEDLVGKGLPAIYAPSPTKPLKGQITVMCGGLSGGMEYPEIGLAIITHGRSLRVKKRRHSKHKKGTEINSIAELNVGDYIVHVSHGIGIYEGIHQIVMQGITKDYIKLRYQKEDMLYVPVTQLDMVSKYIGSKDEVKVKLHKLGGQEWQSAKSRVKKAVKDIAKELIALYAKRMSSPGHAFEKDGEWQYDFERRFEYEETDDQLRSVDEIKADMEKTSPMDRLLCGDVGFGKTEVALRAAFKCISQSKQCAFLVPTTILAFQHYNTIISRFEGFPVSIEMISRFRSAKQQKETIEKLSEGRVDVLVGTHRMLSKDIVFSNLGLVIIDEEQRFGVAQKEKLKEIAPNVDVLTLTATPIPRTLNMAMSGVRDMSVIEEAPLDRRPVQTYVVEHDFGVLTEAISRELRRGGQVFYLHNRIDSIERTAMTLQNRLPDARIGFAHGKMTEEQLSDIWRQMINHEIDILVCTTIIETGVDIPNANTLIIENADNFGLSQLHQIRGRVGRSARRAFAYLTFVKGKMLSEIATKRLEAMRNFTEFGAGFKIAMRDMEIRGAGNILGAQQHGHMEAVGYEMYLRLLNDAVNEEKGIKIKPHEECLIDIQVSAHIPDSYISVNSQRLDVYRRIADIRSYDDSLDVYDELVDRFGDPPEAVEGLVDVALIRNRASDLGFYEVKQNGDQLFLYQRQLDMEFGGKLTAMFPGKVMVSAGAKPYFVIKLPKDSNVLEILKQVFGK